MRELLNFLKENLLGLVPFKLNHEHAAQVDSLVMSYGTRVSKNPDSKSLIIIPSQNHIILLGLVPYDHSRPSQREQLLDHMELSRVKLYDFVRELNFLKGFHP